MNKTLLLVASLTLLFKLNAQVIKFEPVLPPTESKNISFMGLHVGESATADIDNDNDLDIIIIGENGNGHYLTNLYENDGNGNFTIVTNTPFEGARSGSVAFADIDNDNDLDLLIAGQNGKYIFYTRLYTNDGVGNFSLVDNTPFASIYSGAIKFADVDADSDLDVFLAGNSISKLYLNDGTGKFSESSNVFTWVTYGSADIADVDGDLDVDIILTGINTQNVKITKLYINNGLGVFSEDSKSATTFEQVYNGSVSFGDADGDNDNDILLTGTNSLNARVTKLYRNNGSGIFTSDITNSFVNVSLGTVFFADLDTDGDNDIYVAGYSNSLGDKVAKIYKNIAGNFTELVTSPFDLVTSGSAIAKDIDGDNDLDIITTGSTEKIADSKFVNEYRTTNVFLNKGNMNFERVKGCSINDFEYSAFDYADIDSDSDLDVVIAGASDNGLSTIVYKNDGNGNYVEYTNFKIPGSYFYGSVELADVNGDTKPDLLITGIDNDVDLITKLYLNNGSGGFDVVSNTPFVGIEYSTSSFFDMDKDGDLDLLLTGESKTNPSEARLYKNNGSGTFTEEVNIPFQGVRNGSVAISDIDGDKDLDVLIAGYKCVSMGSNSISCDLNINLYTNNGLGVFTKSSSSTLPNIGDCTVTFEDVDNDGDQDLLLTGTGTMSKKYASIYKNNGSGIFNEDVSISLAGVDEGSVAFGNINGDNYIDLLIAGYSTDLKEITTLYVNDGFGGFSKVESATMDGLSNGCVALLDIDKDGDDDVLTSGSGLTKLYRNSTIKGVPTDVKGDQVLFANHSEITLFPNPTNGDVAIDLNGCDVIKIQVFNSLGVLHFEDVDVTGAKYDLRLNGGQGIYFIKVSTQQFEKTFKVIKK